MGCRFRAALEHNPTLCRREVAFRGDEAKHVSPIQDNGDPKRAGEESEDTRGPYLDLMPLNPPGPIAAEQVVRVLYCYQGAGLPMLARIGSISTGISATWRMQFIRV